ncbi:MAG TPA: type IV pilus assembly protein PilM [Acidimicrobiales bacterium]|jgi:type IV pilus assembly protein PilM|nr:type IV pilus assembly protein PilM [Acidimicrobiales bacterium]
MPQLIVGLDIGTSAVRAAELDVSSKPPRLINYGQIGLPPGSVVDGEIQDATAVSEAVRRLWKNGQFSTTSVIVGIAGLRAITREIDLPYVPDNEVDSAVRFHSEEVIPFPPDKTILSSQILADYTAPEGGKMRRVLVAAAHSDLVEGVVAVAESAGLVVKGVDLVSSALVRAISDGTSGDQPEAIVSVGAGLTVVVIHQNGRPQFVRTIGSGGNAVTAAIASSLDLPLADAEALKRRLGEPMPQVHAAQQAIRGTVDNLISEIRNSVQYFATLPGRLPVSQILVTGGGSSLHGFIPMLGAQIHLPVHSVSPLARLDVSKVDLTPDQAAQVSPVLSTPIGLGLPESNPAVKQFNLLPPEVIQRTRINTIQQRTMLVAAVIVALLGVFGAWKFFQVRSAQNDVSALNASISSLNAQIPKYDLVVSADTAYNAGSARRTAVLGASIDWPNALSNLIAITPPNLQVQSFAGTTGNGSAAASTAGAVTPTTATPAASSSVSASIGFVATALNGPGPGLTSPSLWTSAIANDSAKLFANPVPTSITTNTDGTVSFPSTISVTPAASLAKNASLQ